MIFRRINSQQGFSMIEVLVASFLGALVVGLTLPMVLVEHSLFVRDSDRAVVQTGAGGGMDLIGVKLRQAGERMGSVVPAIEIVNGSSGGTDELIIRRSLLDEHLWFCNKGKTSQSRAIFYNTNKNCQSSAAVTEWTNYLSSNGGEAEAFAYNSQNGNNDFFITDSITSTATQYRLWRKSGEGNWPTAYHANKSKIYIMDQWKFYVGGNYLKVQVNENTAENVIYGVTDFQVTATLVDTTVLNSFDHTDGEWTNIHFVNIDLTTEYTGSSGGTYTKVISNSFFPRNSISNVTSSY